MNGEMQAIILALSIFAVGGTALAIYTSPRIKNQESQKREFEGFKVKIKPRFKKNSHLDDYVTTALKNPELRNFRDGRKK